MIDAKDHPVLDAFLAEYAAIEAEIGDKVKRLETLKDEIKKKARAATGDHTNVFIKSPYWGGKMKRVNHRSQWNFQSAKFKTEHPVEWIKYAKQIWKTYFEDVKSS